MSRDRQGGNSNGHTKEHTGEYSETRRFATMGTKVHKSLRIDSDLVKRIELLKLNDEPLSSTMCRVMEVGCDTLEHTPGNTKKSDEHDANTRKIIALLEAENARLVATNEVYTKAIADKDKQIVAALERAHELADQSHVLLGMAQENQRIANADEGGEVLDITPSDKPMTFGEWLKQRFK